MFLEFKALVEDQTGLKIKRLATDNGGKNRNRIFGQKWHYSRDHCAVLTTTEWSGCEIELYRH
jgi:hypothetical protein